jgi:hypothetical protein
MARLPKVVKCVRYAHRSEVRTGNGPRVMTSLRNLAITILRLNGETSIAAALRHHARRTSRPLQKVCIC